ncbi:hypothetical protein NEDG_00716 [Nematocida displodere]|uniref:GP-PDE domain-containing protein n=1 Tax=Nematocida displodere TaxID=1805483 RepID=A0A177ECA0_9MICR|nr:hypothetical protein NEDG_00716 [Nematocida displodere]
MRINLGNKSILAVAGEEYVVEADGPNCIVFVNEKKGPVAVNGQVLPPFRMPGLMGHRGLTKGDNENTTASIIACEEIGVAMVEIDVQLTCENDVVVMHNTVFRDARVEDTPTEVLLAQGVELFSDLLQNTSIGINVEIKYENSNIPPQEYCRRVVDVVSAAPRSKLWASPESGEGASQAPIIYSSFSKQICSEMRAYTPNVLYITETFTREEIAYASSASMLGLVTEDAEVLKASELVLHAKKEGLYLITYGDLNNRLETVSKQLMLGVDSVISDNVRVLAKFL